MGAYSFAAEELNRQVIDAQFSPRLTSEGVKMWYRTGRKICIFCIEAPLAPISSRPAFVSQKKGYFSDNCKHIKALP